MIGIYKISSPSGRVYIGQSWNIELRWRQHKNSINRKLPIYNSLEKYGFDTHRLEVVHELPNDVEQPVLDTYEQLYIGLYKDCGIQLLNVAPGGLGGAGYKHRDEDKKRMSELAKQRGIPDIVRKKQIEFMTGRKLDETVKDKIRNSLIGKTFTDERKSNMSSALKGRSSNSGSFKPGFGSKLSKEQVLEIRDKYKPREYSFRKLAKEYSVDNKTIRGIINRTTWKHI